MNKTTTFTENPIGPIGAIDVDAPTEPMGANGATVASQTITFVVGPVGATVVGDPIMPMGANGATG